MNKRSHTHTHTGSDLFKCVCLSGGETEWRKKNWSRSFKPKPNIRNEFTIGCCYYCHCHIIFFSLSLSLLFYFLYCEECVIGALQPSICWHLLTLCLFVCTLCFIRFRIQFLMHKPIKHFLFSFFDNGICSKKHKNSLSINGALA